MHDLELLFSYASQLYKKKNSKTDLTHKFYTIMEKLNHVSFESTIQSREFEIIDKIASDLFKLEEPTKIMRPISFYFHTLFNMEKAPYPHDQFEFYVSFYAHYNPGE